MSVRSLYAAIVVAAGAIGDPMPIGAQERSATRLEGVFALDLSRQNVIGGSLVRGVDVLQQSVRSVVSVSGGARLVVSSRLVLGAELGVGWFDGAMRHEDESSALTIDYNTRSQSHWGLTAGYLAGAGRSTLVFGYLSEVSRDFEVMIVDAGQVVRQSDGQGLLRYGMGIEQRIRGSLAFRVAAGSSRADFAGRETNIKPRRPLEMLIGTSLIFP